MIDWLIECEIEVIMSELKSLSLAANFNFLLRYYSYKSGTEDGKKALGMVLKTLEFMEKGGIHDHVGQVRIEKLPAPISMF